MRDVESVCREVTDTQLTGNRQTGDRHHRWRIRLASGSKQAARATPTARSACFVPQSACHGFTQQMTFHSRPRKRAPPKTLYINNIDIRGSVKTPDPRTFIYLYIRQLSATLDTDITQAQNPSNQYISPAGQKHSPSHS